MIECCQVAAEKSQWPISTDARSASSLVGGGEGWRAEIPETTIDQIGKIGERRRSNLPFEPSTARNASGRVAAGVRRDDTSRAAEAQDTEMVIEPGRTGYLGKESRAQVNVPATTSATPAAVRPSTIIAPSAAPSRSAPPAPAQSNPVPLKPSSSSPIIPTPPVAQPEAPSPPESKPFERGLKRPGVSRFISGTRRR